MRLQATPFATIREALLNISSSPTRSAITMLISAAAGACVILATVSNVDAIVRAHELQQLRGLSTISVTSVDGHALSAASCDAMNSISAVEAAGGAIRTDEVAVANAASPVKVRYVTPGYLAAAYPAEQLRGKTSIAGEDLKKEIGLTDGSALAVTTPTHDRGLHVAVAATSPSRLSGINRDVLIAVAPSGGVSECLVQASDGQATLVSSLVGPFFPEPIVVRPFLQADAVDRDPATELANRWSGILWMGIAASVILLVVIGWAARRQETALYRLLGFDRRSLGAVVAFETLVTTVVPAQLASLWALSLVPITGGQITLTAVSADSSRFVLALMFCPIIAIVISLTGSTVDRLKGQ